MGNYNGSGTSIDATEKKVVESKKDAPGQRMYMPATQVKYWYPKLLQTAWGIVNYTICVEVGDAGKQLDSTTNWLHRNTKGTEVFAIYSTENPEGSTLLLQ